MPLACCPLVPEAAGLNCDHEANLSPLVTIFSLVKLYDWAVLRGDWVGVRLQAEGGLEGHLALLKSLSDMT